MTDAKNVDHPDGMIPKKKALFIDRDGVINEDSAYPYKPEHIVFKDGIFDLCGKAQEKGYLIVAVTNQAGVAKGYFQEEDVDRLHAWMKEKFLERGIGVAGFYFCPYHVNGTVEKYRRDSDCRKPRPGMILQAEADLGIDISRSLMVGDKESDRIALPELKSVIIKSKYVPENWDVEKLKDVERYL
jgi:D-glycero-D-manno-heptose 1,7-bisphosphate phosphatase